MKPLADLIRPRQLSEVYGQQHILGENKILDRIVKGGRISNMIFYGPPGVGKTTVANIVAEKAGKRFYKLNATNASLKDIQEITKELDTFLGVNGVVLYLDEIQNFNKKQQQSLLEYIEDGKELFKWKKLNKEELLNSSQKTKISKFRSRSCAGTCSALRLMLR